MLAANRDFYAFLAFERSVVTGSSRSIRERNARKQGGLRTLLELSLSYTHPPHAKAARFPATPGTHSLSLSLSLFLSLAVSLRTYRGSILHHAQRRGRAGGSHWKGDDGRARQCVGAREETHEEGGERDADARHLSREDPREGLDVLMVKLSGVPRSLEWSSPQFDQREGSEKLSARTPPPGLAWVVLG